MLRHRSMKFAAALGAALGLLAISTGSARAIGYYNLPGSFCQSFGYGNGAGHHACLVLGPVSCAGFSATNEVRLDHPPQPPYGYYDYCGNGPSRAMSRGTWLEGPETSPEPAAMRPQILR